MCQIECCLQQLCINKSWNKVVHQHQDPLWNVKSGNPTHLLPIILCFSNYLIITETKEENKGLRTYGKTRGEKHSVVQRQKRMDVKHFP